LQQKEWLAERFDLPADRMDDLSLYVGNSLDLKSEVNLTKITRSKALSRGQKRLERTAQLARRMRTDHAEVEIQIDALNTHFSETPDAEHTLIELLADLARIGPVIK